MLPPTWTPRRPNLDTILVDEHWRWVLPFDMIVIGYPPAFEKLGLYVGPGNKPDGTPKLAGGAHFWRTLEPIIDAFRGLRTPAVERLIAAHAEHGVTPEEVADTVRWVTTLMRAVAADLGWPELDEMLQEAGLEAGLILNASAMVPLSLQEADNQLREYFDGPTLMPGMMEAFWEVASWPAIEGLIPPSQRHPAAVLAHCRQFLPRQFVNQFLFQG